MDSNTSAPAPAGGLPSSSSGAVPLISIIIPMLNEREGLKILCSTLAKSGQSIAASWEIVVIDDGSTDGTREVIAQELAAFPKWQVLILSRNFGQQPAYR